MEFSAYKRKVEEKEQALVGQYEKKMKDIAKEAEAQKLKFEDLNK